MELSMKGHWKFDERIAKNFDFIARREIPNYEEIISTCVDFALSNFSDTRAKIIDIGSATGYTLERLRNAGFTEVYGVDNSKHMLERSRVQENLIHADVFPKGHGPFDLVLANWTLHFIPERHTYMSDIHESLRKRGVLILTDKMTSSPLMRERYHDFKRRNGVSQEDIDKKAAAIEGVLVTRPLEWYIHTLHTIGFHTVETAHSALGFVTLIAWK